ncbi:MULTISPECIES: DNA glycosylase AlkZ-like family protein [unclassified Microbacterium]|uniref:DNA glycosylase AlkZ-like family protein n=1 Tax=unclassified Microbacterium TaxID=2609290 RepID=UPI0012FAAD0C|nr:crosslink repair DNA glycosylase YcaQ family protein [Microbacterium sp. MAH-37]MVQ42559.1 winged helix-turn-helix domain-containing protein [Microbacterium sp. MAH-37]
MTVALSKDEARRVIVRAALLDAERPGDVVEVAEQIGYIKIDPTATIAPCEHTMAWSRIGWSYEPGQLKKAAEEDRQLFEYNGTFLPVSLLPAMLPGMTEGTLRESTRSWLAANDGFRRDVLARLRAEGPLLASEIPDTAQVTKAPDGWTGSNQVPIMLDVLSHTAEVAVVGREGRSRRWDLAERVYPQDGRVLGAQEAADEWSSRLLQAAGLARPYNWWNGVSKTAGEAASVEGSSVRFRVDPAALAALEEPDRGGRVAFLNPYDNLLFDRKRLEEVFDFSYVLEQFKPKAQRVYGYFAHPILFGDRFIGMLDAEHDRKREVLQVNAVHEFFPWDADEHELVRAEIQELAEWLGVPVAGLA